MTETRCARNAKCYVPWSTWPRGSRKKMTRAEWRLSRCSSRDLTARSVAVYSKFPETNESRIHRRRKASKTGCSQPHERRVVAWSRTRDKPCVDDSASRHQSQYPGPRTVRTPGSRRRPMKRCPDIQPNGPDGTLSKWGGQVNSCPPHLFSNSRR